MARALLPLATSPQTFSLNMRENFSGLTTSAISFNVTVGSLADSIVADAEPRASSGAGATLITSSNGSPVAGLFDTMYSQTNQVCELCSYNLKIISNDIS